MSQSTVFWIKRTILRHSPLLAKFTALTPLCQPQAWHSVWHCMFFLAFYACLLHYSFQTLTHVMHSIMPPNFLLFLEDESLFFMMTAKPSSQTSSVYAKFCLHLIINMNISSSPKIVFVSNWCLGEGGESFCSAKFFLGSFSIPFSHHLFYVTEVMTS